MLTFTTDTQRVINNLRGAEYKFAKTMPHIPHYYTVGKGWEDFDEFIWTANYIVVHGISQIFFKSQKIPRQYFYLDDWRYWVMDKNPRDAAIINRERKDIRSPRWSE